MEKDDIINLIEVADMLKRARKVVGATELPTKKLHNSLSVSIDSAFLMADAIIETKAGANREELEAKFLKSKSAPRPKTKFTSQWRI